jgi:hypothetical protein
MVVEYGNPSGCVEDGRLKILFSLKLSKTGDSTDEVNYGGTLGVTVRMN